MGAQGPRTWRTAVHTGKRMTTVLWDAEDCLHRLHHRQQQHPVSGGPQEMASRRSDGATTKINGRCALAARQCTSQYDPGDKRCHRHIGFPGAATPAALSRSDSPMIITCSVTLPPLGKPARMPCHGYSSAGKSPRRGRNILPIGGSSRARKGGHIDRPGALGFREYADKTHMPTDI